MIGQCFPDGFQTNFGVKKGIMVLL